MTSFAGRVEARLTIPTGGASVSASTGARSAASTVTLPAGNYYLTQAGGVSSLLTLQNYLTLGLHGYPEHASALGHALGYGTWTSGAAWLCNESSGALAPVFGAPSLSALSTPTYLNAGLVGGGDYAIGFDSTSDAFSGGDVFDVTGTDDLIVVWVAKHATTPGSAFLVSKGDAAPTGYFVQLSATGTFLATYTGTGNPATAEASNYVGEWHVGIVVIDRSTGKMRVGTRGLTSLTSSVTAEATPTASTIANAVNFCVGSQAALGATAPTTTTIAYVGVVSGASAATGLSANLSSALTSFGNAVNSFWAASVSTTDGRVSIANSFWPVSISWTSTALRDVLGFEDNFDYPQTAAKLAAITGGTWTAGYLCNESSGDLAAIFGTPATATATSTPTYSNVGPRGGADKAVGFDSAADAFSLGDNFDVDASSDLIVAWVGKWDSALARDILCKFSGSAGWAIYSPSTSAIRLYLDDTGANTAAADTGSLLAGEWYVGLAAVDRAAGTLRIGVHGLRTGASSISANTSLGSVGDTGNATSATLGQHATVTGNGSGHQVAALYIGTGSGCAAGVPANMTTALASLATHMTYQTGTEQARGLWIPDSPLNCDDHPSMAPDETDVRMSESPTGVVLGLSGNVKYVHTNVTWQRCPVSQIREAEATYANGSLEVFFRDAVSGLGAHEWMGPASPMQIWWNSAGVDTLLGEDANAGTGTAGWTLVGVRKFSDVAKPSQRGWVGQWDVTFGRLVSEG